MFLCSRITTTRKCLFACFLSIVLPVSPVIAADYVIGAVEAQHRVIVSAETQGTISERSVSLGDRVQAGQVLLTLDDRDAQLSIELEKRKLQLSRAEYEGQLKTMKRLTALVRKKVSSQSKLDDQQRILQISAAQVEVERQILAQSQRQKEKNRITAPFGGIISARYVEKGQWVNAGDPVFEVINIDTVIVKINVLEEDLISLKTDHRLQVYIPSIDYRSSSKIVRISPTPNNGKGYPVELELENLHGRIKPGFRAEVSLTAGETQ